MLKCSGTRVLTSEQPQQELGHYQQGLPELLFLKILPLLQNHLEVLASIC